jgi:hypothetical protein
MPNELRGIADGKFELGVRFQALVAGSIDAIWFVKAADSTAGKTTLTTRFFSSSHLRPFPDRQCSLWTSSGALLARGVLPRASEGAALTWQRCQLNTSVAIAANVQHVASFWNSGDLFRATPSPFTADTITRGSLVLVNARVGLHASADTPTFPTVAINTTYYVDVEFVAEPSTPTPTLTTASTFPPTSLVVSTASATLTTFAPVTNPSSFSFIKESSTATTSAPPTTSAPITNPSATPTTFAALESALISTTSTPSSGTVEPWVIGVIVGGAILALLLVGVVGFCLVKRRRARQPPADKAAAAEMKPQSNYAQLSVPSSNYDQGRLKANDEQPAPSNYAVIPAKSASDYDSGRMDVEAAAGAPVASEYHVGRLLPNLQNGKQV